MVLAHSSDVQQEIQTVHERPLISLNEALDNLQDEMNNIKLSCHFSGLNTHNSADYAYVIYEDRHTSYWYAAKHDLDKARNAKDKGMVRESLGKLYRLDGSATWNQSGVAGHLGFYLINNLEENRAYIDPPEVEMTAL